MFYTIHRSFKALCWGVALLVLFKIYERREIFEPAIIWYEVWDNGGLMVQEPKSISGRVEHVYGSQTFVLTTKSHNRFNVRLMGLKRQSEDQSVESIARENGRRELLEKLIKNKWVHIELAYENMHSLGGVVFVGATNINAEMVRLGAARTGKTQIAGLPAETQYALIWASRHRLNRR